MRGRWSQIQACQTMIGHKTVCLWESRFLYVTLVPERQQGTGVYSDLKQKNSMDTQAWLGWTGPYWRMPTQNLQGLDSVSKHTDSGSWQGHTHTHTHTHTPTHKHTYTLYHHAIWTYLTPCSILLCNHQSTIKSEVTANKGRKLRAGITMFAW